MIKYQDSMKNYVNQLYNEASQESLSNAENQLRSWMAANDKDDIVEYYNDPNFGICYTQCLYKARSNCFLALLNDTTKYPAISEAIKESETVYSYGCGPGPEIAAYVCHLRNRLQQPHKQLKVIAVDRVAYWRDYIRRISTLDQLVQIEFRAYELNRSSVSGVKRADVCIMSYSHAAKFDDIWTLLKQKFRLVLVLDQSKQKLHQSACRQDYTVAEFECKDTKKYFYHVSKQLCLRGEHQLQRWTEECCATVQVKCRAGQHFVSQGCSDSGVPPCHVPIDQVLNCRHTKRVLCSQRDHDHNCDKMVQKWCKKNAHKRMEKCSTEKDHFCLEIYEIMLPCSHKKRVHCFHVNQEHKCTVSVSKKCREGEHARMEECGEKKTYVCAAFVQTLLPCKHEKEVQCSRRHQNHYCAAMVQKKCNEGQHQRIEECSEKKRYLCAELVQALLPCKHEKEVQCSRRHQNHYCAAMVQKKCEEGEHERGEECSSINPHICMELATVSLRCSHQKVVECGQRHRNHYCTTLIQRMCASGLHKNMQECSSTEKCKVSVQLRLLCGHVIEVTCDKLHFYVVPFPRKVNLDGLEEPLPVTLLVHPLSLRCELQYGLPQSCSRLCSPLVLCRQSFCGRVHRTVCCGHQQVSVVTRLASIFSWSSSWNPDSTMWSQLLQVIGRNKSCDGIRPILERLIEPMVGWRVGNRLLAVAHDLHRFIRQFVYIYSLASLEDLYKADFLQDLCLELLLKLDIASEQFDSYSLVCLSDELDRLYIVHSILKNSSSNYIFKDLKIFDILTK